jgi:hypothetical protein
VFTLRWTPEASEQYGRLRAEAQRIAALRDKGGKGKSSRPEGLVKQVHKTLGLLAANPRHPGLQTHAYESLKHPFTVGQKVFEAYTQQNTPGAFRVFWCYGPGKKEITIIAITPHP